METTPAGFVGLPVNKSERSQVLIYRLDILDYDARAGVPVWMHLFAETRYRLWVNGVFVSSGPARFTQAAPLYDSVELGQFFKAGPNCVAVEVHNYGCSSFQAMPGGRDGFIAWGGRGGLDFSTPGSWKVRDVPGWARDSALYTFALNPCEIRDTRKTKDEWYLAGSADEGWEAARRLPDEEIVWGELSPRNVPESLFARALPSRMVVTGNLVDPGAIFGFHFPDGYPGVPNAIERDLSKAFQFWVASEVEQAVEFWHHWGAYWVNGDKVGVDSKEEAGLRIVSEVQLKRGWNCFCGYVNYLPNTVYWDCLFRLPSDRGLQISAFPVASCKERLRLSPLIRADRLSEWLDEGVPRSSAKWSDCDGDPWKLTPARVVAWLQLDASTERREISRDGFGSELGAVSEFGTVWVFDFGREVLGHIEIEIEGVDGQVVDVGFDEWQKPNGLIDLYRTNPFAHTVDRYILRGGGSQTLLGLNPRGGRFVQVVVYPEKGQGVSCRLRAIRIIETRTLKGCEGTFCDGDPVDEAIWKASVNTVIGSAEDVYSDSPWRERGAYIGDFTVNQLVNGLINPDMTIARRCLQLFAQAQREDGQFACVAPAHHRVAHEDFSLIWIIGLWENWAITGDKSLIEELWPNLERLWESSVWMEGAGGLWDAGGMHLFIDWGVVEDERRGLANAVLNALRVAALEKSALLAKVIGLPSQAENFEKEAKRVRKAFSELLWREDVGRYAAYIDETGSHAESSAAHANLLAWVFEIGSVSQITRVEDYLFDFLDGNYEFGNAKGPFAGHIELYFFRYLLSALAERGNAEQALRLIRQHWGPLVKDGFGTLPECFHRFQAGIGSRCHGWSGYPAVWYMERVLGLRQEFAGDPDLWLLAPEKIAGIDRASGVLPHRLGMICVGWQRRGECFFEVKIEAPDGVSVRFVENSSTS